MGFKNIKIIFVLFVFLSGIAVCGCEVRTRPLTDWERAVRVDRDMREMFHSRPLKLGKKIDLYGAFSLALKNNLNRKLKIMQEALTHAQTGSATLEMLPKIMAQAGYDVRTQEKAYNSENHETGTKSDDFLIYSGKEQATGKLSFSWNLLDFGVSYFNAMQLSNQALIKQEQRRKVIHNLLKDVRQAYWKAYSAQKLLPQIDDITEEALVALNEAKNVEKNILKHQDRALSFQISLMETLEDIRKQRRELANAQVKLASLMGLKPGTNYSLVGPQDGNLKTADINIALDRMEWLALMNRAELRIEDYQLMIDRYETRKQVYSLIPGLNLVASRAFDTNPFLYNQSWGEMAAKVTFNLLNPGKISRRYEAGAIKEQVDDLKRQVLTMAVLTQVHVAWGEYHQAMDDFLLQSELAQASTKVAERTANVADLENIPRAEQIRVSAKALLLNIKKHLAYADYQNALGSIYATIGLDPVPEKVLHSDKKEIARVLQDVMNAWDLGRFTPEDTPMMVPVPSKKPSIVVDAILPDKTVLEGESFAYQVDSDVFEDAKLASDVSYSATLSDGSELPNWLYFDGYRLILSGQVPANHQRIMEIVVHAKDSKGASAKASFNLDIKRGYMATVDVSGASKDRKVTVIRRCKGKGCVDYKSRFEDKKTGKNVIVKPINIQKGFD